MRSNDNTNEKLDETKLNVDCDSADEQRRILPDTSSSSTEDVGATGSTTEGGGGAVQTSPRHVTVTIVDGGEGCDGYVGEDGSGEIKSRSNSSKSIGVTVTITDVNTGMSSSASQHLLCDPQDGQGQGDGIDEIMSCSESEVEGDQNSFGKPIMVPRTTPFKSAQRRWSLNFAKNRKYIYQRTINLMPSRRLRLSVDNPLLNQKYENIEQLTQDFEDHDELMEDSRIAEQKRVETIRSLPQGLTVKRQIRANLNRTVQRRSSSANEDFWKKVKNFSQLLLQTTQNLLQSTEQLFEIWYSSLKEVEGHFGSSVGAFFKFLRFLFILNVVVAVFMVSTIALPQFLYEVTRPYDQFSPMNCSKRFVTVVGTNDTSTEVTSMTIGITEDVTETYIDEANLISEVDWDDEQELRQNLTFDQISEKGIQPNIFLDLFTGEGWMTDTVMFYGSYTNESITLDSYAFYNMSTAYFVTIMFLYALIFIILSISVGRSYRRSFIESSSSVHKLFSHKLLCSWDYGISNLKAAQMKQKTIFFELRELLNEADTKGDPPSIWNKIWDVICQVAANLLIVFILIGLGLLLYMLMEHVEPMNENRITLFYTPIAVNLSILAFHLIFKGLSIFEEYRSPGTVLHIHLFRNFMLEITLIVTLLHYWTGIIDFDFFRAPNTQQSGNNTQLENTTQSDNSTQSTELPQYNKHPCWETALGQQIYRIILVDLVFNCIGVPVYYTVRYLLKRHYSKRFNMPAFDISHECLTLVFNQIFMWLGMAYAPMLPVIVVIKMAIVFYVKKIVVIRFCKAPPKLWRTSQTQTLFMVLTFLSLFAVTILNGYIATTKAISPCCGPFRGRASMFEVVTTEINDLKDDNFFWTIIASLITKPAAVAGILLTMCVFLYYLRAKSQAHKAMVKLLKEMLYLESKDKEFLLENIKRLTQDAGFIFDEPETVIKNGVGSFYGHRRNASSGSYTGWLLSQSPHRRKSSGVGLTHRSQYDKNK